MNSAQQTITSIQDKQVRQELAAMIKHGNHIVGRAVIFSARTRATKSLISLGMTMQHAKEAVRDAADMAELEFAAR